MALSDASEAVCEEYGWSKDPDFGANLARLEFGKNIAIAALKAVRDSISDNAVEDGVQAMFGMDERNDVRRAWEAIIDAIITEPQS